MISDKLKEEFNELFKYKLSNPDFKKYANEALKILNLFYNDGIINEEYFPSGDFQKRIVSENELLDYIFANLVFYENKKTVEEVFKETKFSFITHVKYARESAFGNGIIYASPYISTILTMNAFLADINKPMSKNNPNYSLINDLFSTIFRKIDGTCKMFELGLYPDAFVSWRTIHESECIVKLLIAGGKTLIDGKIVEDKEIIKRAYVKHLVYNNALRNDNEKYLTKEERDFIFEEMKSEMNKHGLKSKDMKKFIEYGWLYYSKYYDPNDVNFKLNFRDGIEKLAELTEASKTYEYSSEITHSSSVFFYVNNEYCKVIALELLYQSAFRVYTFFLDFLTEYFKRNPSLKESASLMLRQLEAIKVVCENNRLRFEEGMHLE